MFYSIEYSVDDQDDARVAHGHLTSKFKQVFSILAELITMGNKPHRQYCLIGRHQTSKFSNGSNYRCDYCEKENDVCWYVEIAKGADASKKGSGKRKGKSDAERNRNALNFGVDNRGIRFIFHVRRKVTDAGGLDVDAAGNPIHRFSDFPNQVDAYHERLFKAVRYFPTDHDAMSVHRELSDRRTFLGIWTDLHGIANRPNTDYCMRTRKGGKENYSDGLDFQCEHCKVRDQICYSVRYAEGADPKGKVPDRVQGRCMDEKCDNALEWDCNDDKLRFVFQVKGKKTHDAAGPIIASNAGVADSSVADPAPAIAGPVPALVGSDTGISSTDIDDDPDL